MRLLLLAAAIGCSFFKNYTRPLRTKNKSEGTGVKMSASSLLHL